MLASSLMLLYPFFFLHQKEIVETSDMTNVLLIGNESLITACVYWALSLGNGIPMAQRKSDAFQTRAKEILLIDNSENIGLFPVNCNAAICSCESIAAEGLGVKTKQRIEMKDFFIV